MSSTPSTKPFVVASLALIVAGIAITAAGGLTSGSLLGGLIACLGIGPACWGMWAGMQQKTQTGMAAPVLLCIASLIVGGILILLRFVDWLR